MSNIFSFYKHSNNWDGHPKIQYYEGLDFVYVPIPKCGSTTMMERFNIKSYPLIDPYKINQFNKFSFTIVRNPYTRLVSTWYGKLKKRWGSDITNINGFYYDMPFKEFIIKVCETEDEDCEQHFAPYHVILNKVNIDYVINLEEFDDEYNKLRSKISLPQSNKIRGTTNMGNMYQDFFDEETYKLVNRKFEQDFISYNYNMIENE